MTTHLVMHGRLQLLLLQSLHPQLLQYQLRQLYLLLPPLRRPSPLKPPLLLLLRLMRHPRLQ